MCYGALRDIVGTEDDRNLLSNKTYQALAYVIFLIEEEHDFFWNKLEAQNKKLIVENLPQYEMSNLNYYRHLFSKMMNLLKDLSDNLPEYHRNFKVRKHGRWTHYDCFKDTFMTTIDRVLNGYIVSTKKTDIDYDLLKALTYCYFIQAYLLNTEEETVQIPQFDGETIKFNLINSYDELMTLAPLNP